MISFEKEGHELWLRISGRLDTLVAEQLTQQVDLYLDSAINDFLIDLHGVDFLSSAAIRLFLKYEKRMKSRQGNLILVGIQAYCRQILEMTGVAEQLLSFPDEASAKRYCQQLEQRHYLTERWSQLSTIALNSVRLKVISRQASSNGEGELRVYGDCRPVATAALVPGLWNSIPLEAGRIGFGIGGIAPDQKEGATSCLEGLALENLLTWRSCQDGGPSGFDYLQVQGSGSALPWHSPWWLSSSLASHDLFYADSMSSNGASLLTMMVELSDYLAQHPRENYSPLLAITLLGQTSQLKGHYLKKEPALQEGALVHNLYHPNQAASWFESVKSSPNPSEWTLLAHTMILNLNVVPLPFETWELAPIFPGFLNWSEAPEGKKAIVTLAAAGRGASVSTQPVDFQEELKRVTANTEWVTLFQPDSALTVKRVFMAVQYIHTIRQMKTPDLPASEPPPASPPPQPDINVSSTQVPRSQLKAMRKFYQ